MGVHPPRAERGARASTSCVALQAAADAVYVDRGVVDYAVNLVLATRDPDALRPRRARRRSIAYGASPRASLGLVAAGRALALLRGRNYALPQDVFDVAPDVLRHRLVLSYEALAQGRRRPGAGPRARTVPAPRIARRRTRRHASPPRRSAASRQRRRSAATGRTPATCRPSAAPSRPTDRDAPTALRRSRPAAEHRHAARREVLRRLELTVTRRLDGLLQGDYRGLVPGHGSELGETRALPARRRRAPHRLERHRPHRRRPTSARRSPTASSRRGCSSTCRPASTSAPPTARSATSRSARRRRVGFLTAAHRQPHRRRAARRPTEPVDRPGPRRAAPPAGAAAPRAHRAAQPTTPAPTDLAAGLDRLGATAAPPRPRRRDLRLPRRPTSWERPLRRARRPPRGARRRGRRPPRARAARRRHARSSSTPRPARCARSRPPTPSSASATPRPPPQQRATIAAAIRSAGADHLVLRTDRDWLLDLVRFVAAARASACSAVRRPHDDAVTRDSDDLPRPQPTVAALGVVALVGRLRRAAVRRRRLRRAVHQHRRCSTRSPRKRPGWRRHVPAIVVPAGAQRRWWSRFAQPAHDEKVPRERATVIARHRHVAVDGGRPTSPRPGSRPPRPRRKSFLDLLPAEDQRRPRVASTARPRSRVAADHRPRARSRRPSTASSWARAPPSARRSSPSSTPSSRRRRPTSGEKVPARIVLMSDGKTTVGRPNDDGVQPRPRSRRCRSRRSRSAPTTATHHDPRAGPLPIPVPVDKAALRGHRRRHRRLRPSPPPPRRELQAGLRRHRLVGRLRPRAA